MKFIFLLTLLVGIILSGCSSQSGDFAFGSSDCEQVYRDCMTKCVKDGKKTRAQCETDCYQARAICRSMKIKGCMQDCNKRYESGSQQNEICKRNCETKF